jgi:UDP-glucose 4-epimerase
MPLSPYGVSKLASEFYLNYYYQIHGLDYVALRYANVYGPRQDPHGEAGVVAIFSSRLIAGEPLLVYGDGLQTRDYVFVDDVVAANLAVTDAVLDATTDMDQRAFNVGTGVETSVLELAQTLARAAGVPANVQHKPARSGELRHNSLDARRLGGLGWRPQFSIVDGLRITYEFIRNGE